jgi:hypothetical protein
MQQVGDLAMRVSLNLVQFENAKLQSFPEFVKLAKSGTSK